jgi:DNA-binding PadR family transcriptional regulator
VADLQLIILLLLSQSPRRGYELIRELEERSAGDYSSPAIVYPALAYLEELAYVESEPTGIYRPTEAGRKYLDENRSSAEAALRELGYFGHRMEDVEVEFAAGTGRRYRWRSQEGWWSRGEPDELRAARRALNAALFQERDRSPEEIKRIADILRRAAAEILGGA